MKVYGMGEKKTPQPFIAACDRFIYIEVIRAKAEAAEVQEQPETAGNVRQEGESAAPHVKAVKKPAKKKPEPAPEFAEDHGVPAGIVRVISESLEMIAEEDGFAFLGTLGHLIVKKRPDFDSRNYGFSKLSQMMRAMDRFEVVDRHDEHNTRHTYVRDRQRR